MEVWGGGSRPVLDNVQKKVVFLLMASNREIIDFLALKQTIDRFIENKYELQKIKLILEINKVNIVVLLVAYRLLNGIPPLGKFHQFMMHYFKGTLY